MRQSLYDIASEFMAEAQTDVVGLWELVKVLKERHPQITQEEMHRLTLDLVGELLERGFKAGDAPYSHGGYRRWDNQTRTYIIERVDRELRALGRDPNIADIVWFYLPRS